MKNKTIVIFSIMLILIGMSGVFRNDSQNERYVIKPDSEGGYYVDFKRRNVISSLFYDNVNFEAGGDDIGVKCEETHKSYNAEMWLVGGKITKEQVNYGINLEEGKNLKQGYISFSRDGKRIGERKYTAVSGGPNDKVVVYHSSSDNISLFGQQTKFHYGWAYGD